LLIRPVSKFQSSRSRFNFEIVLLDHGLWFDIAKDLRVNYARLWLSLLAPKTEAVDAERRKYAELVGNIGPDLFPIFEAAITGRAGISEQDYDDTKGLKGTLEGSLMGLATQTPEDAQRLRNAFMQEGMLESIFELLRKVPRRLLMVLKIK
jgi:aarF domain-containing kinase